MEEKALYTEAEFARRLGIPTATLANLRRQGKVHHVRLGRWVRYTLSQIEDFKTYFTKPPTRGAFE